MLGRFLRLVVGFQALQRQSFFDGYSFLPIPHRHETTVTENHMVMMLARMPEDQFQHRRNGEID